MKENQLQLSLSYHGTSVDDGRYDIYSAAANMIAFSDFVTVAGKAVYGPTVELKAEVAGFRAGSFITEVYFQLLLPSMALLPTVDVQTVLKTIKDAMEIWKHLKGSPPKAIENSGDGDSINLINSNGNTIIVNRPSLTVVLSSEGTAAVERFVGMALANQGIDSLQIKSAKKTIAKVKDSEAMYFTTVSANVPVTDNEFEYALTIESAALREGLKWRFSDGGASFSAEITDDVFLKRVDQGESFAKGDALRVRMRLEQTRKGQELTTVRTVIKVHEHLKRHQYSELF